MLLITDTAVSLQML